MEALWTALWISPPTLVGHVRPAYGADVEPLSEVRFVLVCEECGAVAADDAKRWRAYLFDVDDDGQDEVLCYCPACAAYEFGGT